MIGMPLQAAAEAAVQADIASFTRCASNMAFAARAAVGSNRRSS
jgi:hypothetical protein